MDIFVREMALAEIKNFLNVFTKLKWFIIWFELFVGGAQHLILKNLDACVDFEALLFDIQSLEETVH